MPYRSNDDLPASVRHDLPTHTQDIYRQASGHALAANRRQDEVLTFLGNAQSYGLNTIPTRIDTHGAIVFLAGDDAYKIKRAVSYSYMDFSTLAKRKAACEAELEINKQNAPDIYLAVVPITRKGNGLQLGGSGPIVEWAVHMRRFDETATLDQLLGRNELTPDVVDSLAQTVLDSHRRAPVCPSADILAATRKVIAQTIGELGTRCGPDERGALLKLAHLLHNAFRANQSALAKRTAAGYVRRSHGDLHLRNIAMIAGRPVLFDAIEFDENLATIDILYDLAFLIMDLLHRGFREFACRLLNRYLWASKSEHDDIAGLSLLPMYLALRASIRAAVLAAQADLTGSPDLSAEITTYLNEAISYLAPGPARVVAIGGLSGSGKSSISDLLAPSIGDAPGAIQLRSDVERKRQFGVKPAGHLGPDAYGKEASDAVYASLCELTALAIRGGRTVILDATFLEEKWRTKVQAVAGASDASFHGVWLRGAASLLQSRLESRGKDASDATVSVLKSQLQKDIGKMDWHVIDASLPTTDILCEIRTAIGPQQPETHLFSAIPV